MMSSAEKSSIVVIPDLHLGLLLKLQPLI